MFRSEPRSLCFYYSQTKPKKTLNSYPKQNLNNPKQIGLRILGRTAGIAGIAGIAAGVASPDKKWLLLVGCI